MLRRREDGYHDIETVFQEIDLADAMVFDRTDGEIDVACNVPELAGESNLCARAARLLRQRAGRGVGVRITLEKRIPWGAGLGGGSGNAATTLLALNRLWELQLSEAQLHAAAAELGADVPYFLYGGCALGRGTGENLSLLPSRLECGLLIVKPPFAVATGEVYRRLPLPHRDRRDVRSAVPVCAAVAAGSVADLCAVMYNALEPAVIGLHPLVAALKQDLLASGAQGALMAGSGSCVFGVYAHPDAARDALRHLEARWDCRFLLSRPVARSSPRYQQEEVFSAS